MKTVIYSATLFVALAIAACSGQTISATPSPASPNDFTRSFSVLDSSTAPAMVEISVLVAVGHSGHVAKVKYVLGINKILAVYPDDGYVIGWDVATGKNTVEYDLGIVSSRALSFDASGALLIGATSHLFKPNRLNSTTEYVNGVALWDMETGELIQCMTYPCQENTSSKDGNIGAVIDPDRRWVFSYSESTISIGDLSGKTEGRLSLVNDLDTDYMWSIGAIAPDAAHDGYAIVFQEGKVWLDTVDRSASRYRTLVDGKKNDVQEVITAKFDPAGQWLAFIRGGYMSVWYLGKKPESLYLEEKVPQAVDLSFDHSGSLLFVGGGDKITIWDLTNKSIVAEHEASGITSLDISEDNRLLIWGDAQGAIHVWGIPAP